MNLILYRHEDGQHKFTANGLEIINPELLKMKTYTDGVVRLCIDKYEESTIKSGDTFPLPSDLKFQEVIQWRQSGSNYASDWKDTEGTFDLNGNEVRTVLRLVKVESKESQEDMFSELVQDMFELGNEGVLNKWTIQRKKP
jgi:hypothetical protein